MIAQTKFGKYHGFVKHHFNFVSVTGQQRFPAHTLQEAWLKIEKKIERTSKLCYWPFP